MKILINTTSDPIDLDIGETIPANSQVTINPENYIDYANSADALRYLGCGSLVVNDGESNLDMVQGTRCLLGGFSGKLQLIDSLVSADGIKIDVGTASIVGPQGEPGPVSIFGSQYHYAESLIESNTDSISSVNKLTLNLSSLPSGLYKLNWSYDWSHDTNNSDFRAEIKLDTTILSTHVNQKYPEKGFISTLSLNGNHTIEINYWTNGTGFSFIKDAKLELWRLS